METDLSSWTNAKLKEHLRSIGLPVSGKKAILIQRIQNYESQSSQVEYDRMTVPELKTLLKDRKLSVTGRKANLIARLKQSDIKNKPGYSEPFIPDLPLEIQRKILLELSDKSLSKACKALEKATKICEDDYFWNLRIQEIYNSDLSKYKEKDKTYREIYRELRKYERKGEDQLLINAARFGYLPIMEYVIEEKHIDMQAWSIIFDEALRLASLHGHLPIVKYLVKRGSDIPTLNESMVLAAGNGNLSIVKYLVENGADIRADHDHALVFTAAKGELSVVKYLIQQGADVNAQNNQSLLWAAGHKQLQIVKHLIEQGADIHARDNLSLRIAIEHNDFPMTKYLIEQGANINVNINVRYLKNFLRYLKLSDTGTKEEILKRILRQLIK